jgi:hypothetical protein
MMSIKSIQQELSDIKFINSPYGGKTIHYLEAPEN